MIEKYKYFLCRGADNLSVLRRLNKSNYVPNMNTTDKHNVLEPAENIGVSLEPWTSFVSICVSEIEQKTILATSNLLILLNCCPDMKSLPQTMLTKHIHIYMSVRCTSFSGRFLTRVIRSMIDRFTCQSDVRASVGGS